MKRMIIISLLILLTTPSFGPVFESLYTTRDKAISYYDPLIKAITKTETDNLPLAINISEQAIGPFQIRAVRVEHYNRLRGTHYSHGDFFDYDLSREMFLYYAEGKSYEQAAKSWNGSGPRTTRYWNKVKRYL